MGRPVYDMEGKIFKRLTVLSRAGATTTGVATWNVRCVCGEEYVVSGALLRIGRAQPCRCRVHGMCGTPTYAAWESMKQRCLNPTARSFKNYGGRGITVCERWLAFENFLADMGVRPDGNELDRTDNSKGYSPENCRWVDRKTNNRNKRTNVMLSFSGRTQCLKDWATELGIHPTTLKKRMANGWPLETALTKKGAV